MLAIIMSIENDSDRDFVLDIYNEYSKKMYSLAYSILKSHADAQDCVHDTIVKLVDHLETFKKAKNGKYLKQTVCLVCQRTAINKYRQNKRRSELEFSTTVYDENGDYEIMDIPDMSSDVEKLVLSEENCEYLKTLINKLDLRYRELLVFKSTGFNNREIADLSEISEALVRKRYSRARAKILELGGERLYEYRNER